uniref:Glycosyl transferase family 25 domain-containing protein n=1 Tax=uncultured Helicobacter sp. TaxID=175537 RepID=A0A650ELD8_9HELI|nr:hypothetical protein Helico4rc_0570 [uncultured Helicobacter sp.]
MKVFVINLLRAKERRETIKKQVQDVPQDFEVIFFDAIDAKNGEHLAFKNYSNCLSYLFRGKKTSDGERACFASHYALWLECVKGAEPIIVLEDDVSLKAEFWTKLRHIAQSPYEYVRLMYLSQKATFLPLENDFLISFDSLMGTQGYYLTPKGASAFILHAKSWFCPVDDYMDMFYIHYVPNVCIKPIIQENIEEIPTTIEGRWKKPPLWLKIIREFSRLCFQIRKWVFVRCFLSRLYLPKDMLDCLKKRRGEKC